MFETENYSPENSIKNLFLLQAVHGGLIAVIHQITGEDESTILFFSDQFVHQANGFHTQDENGRAALQAVVGSILGGWVYPDAIEALVENVKKTIKTVNYCFGPVGYFETLAKENNLGYNCYSKFIEELYLQDLGETIIVKEALA